MKFNGMDVEIIAGTRKRITTTESLSPQPGERTTIVIETSPDESTIQLLDRLTRHSQQCGWNYETGERTPPSDKLV